TAGWASVRRWRCGDEMCHHRKIVADVERAHEGDELAIRDGHALVLAEVLRPRFDREGLHVACRVGGVAEHAPELRAVATPHPREPADRAYELLGARRLDEILHRDEHGAAVRGEIAGERWRRDGVGR